MSLSYHAERIWSNAAQRPDVLHHAIKKGTCAFWTIRKGDSIALRWCTILDVSDGNVRFTNTHDPNPPKSFWSVPHSIYLTRRLEITLFSGELDEAKYARLAEIFSYPEKALDWELLQVSASDTNLWSEAAVAAERQARQSRSSR